MTDLVVMIVAIIGGCACICCMGYYFGYMIGQRNLYRELIKEEKIKRQWHG